MADLAITFSLTLQGLKFLHVAMKKTFKSELSISITPPLSPNVSHPTKPLQWGSGFTLIIRPLWMPMQPKLVASLPKIIQC
jgi:hypothetical protein